MKYRHESQFAENPFKVDESIIYKLQAEMEQYWDEVERINKAHQCDDLKIQIDTNASFTEIIEEISVLLGRLEDISEAIENSNKSLPDEIKTYLEKLGVNKSVIELIPIDANPFEYRNWEFHNIGISNFLNIVRLRLMQLEIKYLEEYLKTAPGDLIAQSRHKTLKQKFIEEAQNAVHID